MKLMEILEMADEIEDVIDDVMSGEQEATATFPIRIKRKDLRKTLRITVTAKVEQ